MDARGEDFGAMTFNGPLSAVGLTDRFDAALASGDRQLAHDFLEQAAMSEHRAGATVDTVLADLSSHGHSRRS